MKKSGIITSVFVAVFITFSGAASAQEENQTGSIQITDEAKFVQMAKVSMNSAINMALKQVPGKVLRAELENENGYLVYGIEIVKADQRISDIKVDAGNGRILRSDSDKQDTENRETENHNDDHEKEE